jgi:hypothetical protein
MTVCNNPVVDNSRKTNYTKGTNTMSFKPKQPELSPLETVAYDLTNITVNPKDMDGADLEKYRLQLANIKKLVGIKMAETATKEHNYDVDAITAYIDDILEDGYNLQATELSDYPEFVDAQKLKRWDTLIAERVEASMFGAKQFKIHSLRLLRSNIASAKTLHDLRQAVTLMISPLELYRDHCVLVQRTSAKQVAIDNKETDQYIDDLLNEIEAKDKLLAERKRVLDEILTVYNEQDEELLLLSNIESAKKEHNLSDTEAAKVFGCSRKKLLAMRERITLVPTPEQMEPTEAELEVAHRVFLAECAAPMSPHHPLFVEWVNDKIAEVMYDVPDYFGQYPDPLPSNDSRYEQAA